MTMKNKKTGAINKEFISQNAIWLILVVLIIVMSIANPRFLSVNNMVTLLTGEACKGIIAFGIMFCILSKGIDISTGSAVAFVGVMAGALVQPSDYSQRIFGSFGEASTLVGILVGILLGIIIGVINGGLIAYTHIPPFIATMGMQLILRALAKVVADRPVSNLPASFRYFGSGYVGPVSYTHLDVYKRQAGCRGDFFRSCTGGQGSLHHRYDAVYEYALSGAGAHGLLLPEPSGACLLYTSRCV